MRAACDRCHAQKLRCSRASGDSRCHRCSRLNTRCSFSPRAPRGSLRSSSTATGKTPIVRSGEGIIDTTPSEYLPDIGNARSVCLELPIRSDALMMPPIAPSPEVSDEIAWEQLQHQELIHDTSLFASNTFHSWESIGQSVGLDALQVPEPTLTTTTAATTAHELAYLSIALSTLSETLPSSPEGDDCGPAVSRFPDSSMPFVMDELFQLTRQFTQLIQDRLLVPIAGPQDEPTALMVASCHSRLTYIYRDLFCLIQRCIQHSLGPSRPRPHWAIVLPKMQLGVLDSPPVRVGAEAIISMPKGKLIMYVSMITVFSEDLLKGLADAVKTQQGRVAEVARESFVNEIWDKMVDRGESLLKAIQKTQQLLG